MYGYYFLDSAGNDRIGIIDCGHFSRNDLKFQKSIITEVQKLIIKDLSTNEF